MHLDSHCTRHSCSGGEINVPFIGLTHIDHRPRKWGHETNDEDGGTWYTALCCTVCDRVVSQLCTSSMLLLLLVNMLIFCAYYIMPYFY